MKGITEIRNWLLENAVDENGNLMLPDLDFSDFDGNVVISGMKVKGSLLQSYQEVRGILDQGKQTVQGSLYQDGQKVEGNYHCRDVKVKGDIFANEPTKLLQEITTEELAELGYKLKGGTNETK